MQRHLKHSFPILAFLSLFTCWLFVGLVKDPEFAEYHLQMKAAPTFKVYFYSPRGMSDAKIEDLSPAEQQAEMDYQIYILGHKVAI